MNLEVRLPKSGMGISEATVVAWLKDVGDPVEEDEPLVEVETAKAIDVVASPVTGFLAEIVAPEGTIVQVLDVLAVISSSSA